MEVTAYLLVSLHCDPSSRLPPNQALALRMQMCTLYAPGSEAISNLHCRWIWRQARALLNALMYTSLSVPSSTQQLCPSQPYVGVTLPWQGKTYQQAAPARQTVCADMCRHSPKGGLLLSRLVYMSLNDAETILAIVTKACSGCQHTRLATAHVFCQGSLSAGQ